METREIGRAGIKSSAIGFGCAGLAGTYYGPIDPAEAQRLLRLAVDLGVTLFDTSDIYGNEGSNETLVARALRDVRHRIVIATKFGLTRTANGVQLNSRPDHVRAACENSLRRLGTDSIDIYYQHKVDPAVPFEDTVGAMAELVREGKVRALGLGTGISGELLGRAHSIHPIACVQSEYSLIARGAERNGLIEACTALGCTHLAYSPLGRGLLTGTISSSADLPPDDFRLGFPYFQADNLRVNHLRMTPLRESAARMGLTLPQLALRWLLSQPHRPIVLPGIMTAEQLRENLIAQATLFEPATLTALQEQFSDNQLCGG